MAHDTAGDYLQLLVAELAEKLAGPVRWELLGPVHDFLVAQGSRPLFALAWGTKWSGDLPAKLPAAGDLAHAGFAAGLLDWDSVSQPGELLVMPKPARPGAGSPELAAWREELKRTLEFVPLHSLPRLRLYAAAAAGLAEAGRRFATPRLADVVLSAAGFYAGPQAEFWSCRENVAQIIVNVSTWKGLPPPVDGLTCPQCGADWTQRKSVSRTYSSKSEAYDDVECLGHYTDGEYFEPDQGVNLRHHDLLDDSDRCNNCGQQALF